MGKTSTEHRSDGRRGEGVAAVDRAFNILAAFKMREEPLSLAEVARRTGLYKSTILRLATSLERAGFVFRFGDGRFAIGPEPLRLAQIYQESFNVRDLLLPVLQDLSRDTGETASFYIRQGNVRVCLHRVEPLRSIRHSVREGDRLPLDLGAAGTVLRAFANRPDMSLGDVRAQCWTVSFGERDPETASIAAPIFTTDQQLKGALSLSGPRERFTAHGISKASKLLLAAASNLTSAFGGDASVYRAKRATG
jgi:DNA-binding IclR family transcriptional regulator